MDVDAELEQSVIAPHADVCRPPLTTETADNQGKIGWVISEISGQGFRHFSFQTPEEGRPDSSAKIEGILTPVQLQTKLFQMLLVNPKDTRPL